MHVHTVRKVINKHSEKLQEELQRRMEKNDGNVYDIIDQDPFFAGQIHALAMLTLELIAIDLDEQLARDLRRGIIT